MVTPRTSPMSVAAIDSPRTERPPHRKRLSTSRPRLSAPSSTVDEGGAYGAATKADGEYGAKTGPMSAVATRRLTRTTPILVRHCRQARLSSTVSGRRLTGAVTGAAAAGAIVSLIAATSAGAG